MTTDLSAAVSVACRIADHRRRLRADLRAAVESGDTERIERADGAKTGLTEAPQTCPKRSDDGSDEGERR